LRSASSCPPSRRHLSLELAGGEGLIIAADAMTNEIVSFEHPGWKFG
jgi:hypothetical protein